MAGEPTFVPGVNPTFDVPQEHAPKVLRADFGDGYSQRSRAGLNHDQIKTTLTWEAITTAEVAVIHDFMKARGGDQAFIYTLPGSAEALKWIAPTYQKVLTDPGLYSYTATLEQVFDI